MATTTTNKRKKAVAATVAAAALLLAGTFAWTSISQTALNEAIVDINPGARLHDDFNGTNKDVYVENFNSADDAKSVAVYARIRLDQYMEIGPDAGINVENGTTGRNVKAITGTDSNDKSTWVTYVPTEDEIEGTTVQAQTHWQWSLGNDANNMPFYMPTFNMNKDSLLPDVNGTYEGTVEGDIVHYDDNLKYTSVDDNATGTEIVDWDSDTLDEDGGVLSGAYNNGGVTTDPDAPIDDADVLHRENKTHNAKQISETATVITMAQWQEMTDEEKAAQGYWIYDTDGWAYWSKAIEPGETTGLFLDGINMNKTPDENWYYAINVVGQFATPGDLSAFDQDAPTGGGGMTEAAKDLMADITELGTTMTISGPSGILPGKTAQYSVSMKKAGMDAETPADVTWSIENINAPAAAAMLASDIVDESGNTSGDDDDLTIEDGGIIPMPGEGTAGGSTTEADTDITIEDGLVTVGDGVSVGTTFEVKAAAGDVTDTFAVEVVDAWQAQVAAMTPGTTKTIEIDNIDWFVLAKEDNQALMVASEPVGEKISLFGPGKDNSDFMREGWYGVQCSFLNEEGTYEGYDGSGATHDEMFPTLPAFSTYIPSMWSSLVEKSIWCTQDGSNVTALGIATYAQYTLKAWLPTVADFAAFSTHSIGNDNVAEKNFTYGKSVITNDMLEIMLGNSEDKAVYTRSTQINDTDNWTYARHYIYKDQNGFALGADDVQSYTELFPMFWVDLTTE